VRFKRKFERKLAENIKQDSKLFFAYVRSKAKGKATVGSVEDKNGRLVNSIEQVCEELNVFFVMVFSNEGSEDIPNAKAMFDGREKDLLCEIDITQDMVKSSSTAQVNRKMRTSQHFGHYNAKPLFNCLHTCTATVAWLINGCTCDRTCAKNCTWYKLTCDVR